MSRRRKVARIERCRPNLRDSWFLRCRVRAELRWWLG